MSAAPSGSPLADLPADLPAPTQDGATKHLIGHPLPVLVELPCTRLTDPHPQSKAQEELEAAIDERGYVDLFNLALSRPVLLFIYPRTPLPSETLPDSWNATPGAGGCDAHVLSIPPLLTQLRTLEPDLQILGLSSQSNAEQQETADRLRLPFRLLSDAGGELREKLELPTFEWEGRSWLKRATLYLRESQVVNLSYPVFPPESAGERALEMLRAYREQMDS
ncbi:unnamed protein product [Tilletia controversa]|uniref:Redoxin domain-containing protein n=2 Tax=Tilletia TaxID=13289 RepID=A0A8X7SY56_9BASI|nr:hypothetical protein CF336_g2752 [Tilletia laevis]KAE8201804.1 hypothetical protein CF328_g2575 [Tilletia controversa]KAE8262817.1 hypothetical protein A4X03_0g2155 [Tilletia caries]KAE8203707.1 hypothetical protein CF335_g2920 [Tilletia laevis]KAE8249423.1 hypothetical protein A4X06_0g3237 [Tilletia controversa]